MYDYCTLNCKCHVRFLVIVSEKTNLVVFRFRHEILYCQYSVLGLMI